MSQDLRQKKQLYLRQHVLEKNYDPQDFIDYCETHKGGADIDSWTYQELIDIVGNYISSQCKSSADDFAQFGEFIGHSQPSKQVEPPKISLDNLDWDFLSDVGSSTGSSTKNQQPKHENSSAFMSVPADIAKKIQQNNNSFVIGFNQSTFQKSPQPQKMQPQKMQKPQKVQKQQKRQEPNIQIPVGSPQLIKQNFMQEVKCRQITHKMRLEGDIQILVSNHQIVNPNFFVPKYVLYTLTINPLNVQIKRRMKQIQIFRDILVKLFPSTQIPFLQKYNRLSETQPHIIKKQTLFIESFLNNLMMNKQIRCKFVQEFLLCKDSMLLKKIFKEYQKLQKHKCIQDLFTKNGFVHVELNSNTQKYLSQQSQVIDFFQTQFAKLKGLYDQLITGFMQNQSFTSISENLKNLNKSYAQDFKISQLQKESDSFSQLHKEWSQSLYTQSKILDAELKHFFRFQTLNFGTIRETLKSNDNINNSYSKNSDPSKQAYFSQKLAEYKTSLEVPSKNSTVLKYQAGYYQYQTSDQIKRYWRELARKMHHKFGLFSLLELNITNDLLIMWKKYQE